MLAANEAYSGYYLVDWCINFLVLKEYLELNIKLLLEKSAHYFLTLHEKAADILYSRLDLE